MVLSRRLLKDRVKKEVLESLAQGADSSGAFLPSERELARRLNASRTTIRGALADLEQEGLISREHGRGTRVVGDRPNAVGEVAVVFNSFAGVTANASGELAALLEGISLGLGSQRIPAYFCPASGYVSASLGTDALCTAAHFAERLRSSVDAAILMEWNPAIDVAQELERVGFPYVIANLETDMDLCGVSVDIKEVGRQAGEQIVRCGYARALVLAGSRRRVHFQQMKRGLETGLGGVEAEWVECVADQAHARAALQARLESGTAPEAIFSYGDERTLATLDVLRERGLSAPQDLGLLCYGRTTPAVREARVSALVQPSVQVGRVAVDLLADRCAGRMTERRRIVPATFAPGATMFF